ncbi:2OG-Fe(II) oxygenase [Methylotenera sp.]|uniref:2OG-Fe(II) oxygenase n=1 Tax=Methylotenera sp. TaxID=2051956 RepID=UPI002719C5E5|nr:2OG-Fe(II) oxygenase [Methylotenera sp.]MDO9203868.1 2OG-Fe(II) oxygenase [Methylotenera sp.]MDP2070375.1 2OG-Fe(II) oxygenase [Methylotenera sp.]MDP3005678.1 2OG-Fe(II) oxygenase [Methylotenera sp.]MDP3817884.1 2OG-Fe(II) oxygenase [Methylotenera sp.]MDZ4210783.1 2OG-Fe(II) oxygenase [Methylotenera sp.]
MTNNTKQTPTLNQWLKSQIARGCAFNDMVASMQTAGYAQADAQAQVTQAFVASSTMTDATMPVTLLEQNVATTFTFSQSASPMADSQPVYQRTHCYTPNLEFIPSFTLHAPRIMVFDQFLSDEECDTLIALSQAKIEDSRVVDPKTGEFVLHPERTSRGTHFEHQSNAVVIALESRIYTLFGFAVNHQEATQILNYPVGGEYRAHYDYFSPTLTGSQAILAQAGQRLATVVMYLNAPKEGGGTAFPNIGLTVTAKKGSAVYFENVDLNGHVDTQTLHAGLPVLAGEKWIATKWLRERALF